MGDRGAEGVRGVEEKVVNKKTSLGEFTVIMTMDAKEFKKELNKIEQQLNRIIKKRKIVEQYNACEPNPNQYEVNLSDGDGMFIGTAFSQMVKANAHAKESK